MTKLLMAIVVATSFSSYAQERRAEPKPRTKGEARVDERAKEPGTSATAETVKPGEGEKGLADGRVVRINGKTGKSSTRPSRGEVQAAVARAEARAAQPTESLAELTERSLKFAQRELGDNAVVAGTVEHTLLVTYAEIRMFEKQNLTISIAKLVSLIKEVRAEGGDLQSIVNNLKGALADAKGGSGTVIENLVKRIQAQKSGEDPEKVRQDVERCARAA